MLTTQEPFYFEGDWAEKIEDKYILHDGIITDCHIPHPWWTLNAANCSTSFPKTAPSPTAASSICTASRFSIFPYFYKALKKEPRKSGFLTPEAGHSSQFGYFFGAGYYWAINRSYDLTYLVTDYTSRGIAQHLDIRGKPNQNTDFNIIAYGVDDHGDSAGVRRKRAGRQRHRHLQERVRRWMDRARQSRLPELLPFPPDVFGSFSEAIYSIHEFDRFPVEEFRLLHLQHRRFAKPELRKHHAGRCHDDPQAARSSNSRGAISRLRSGSLPLWFSFDTSFGLFHRVRPDVGATRPITTDEPVHAARRSGASHLHPSFHWQGLSIVPTFTMHETFYGQSFDQHDTVVPPR